MSRAGFGFAAGLRTVQGVISLDVKLRLAVRM
jgi:hypothetical protein